MNRRLRELHLFAGAGGGILGGLLLGHVPVCAVELEEYPRRVLLQRQRDGILPWFPVWDDIRTFDGTPWRGRVDVVCGGFPCQDISSAGKGAGIDGERSGLWSEMSRVIRQVRPRFVFVENSPMLTSRGLGRVLGDLATLGFDARWGVLGADDASAPHIRKRIWILAEARCLRHQHEDNKVYTGWNADQSGCSDLANPVCFGRSEMELHDIRGTEEEGAIGSPIQCAFDGFGKGRWSDQPLLGGMADGLAPWLDGPWAAEPADLPRLASGVKNRVGRLKAIGNGQVPQVAAMAFRTLYRRLVC